jgi:hypothetical protein
VCARLFLHCRAVTLPPFRELREAVTIRVGSAACAPPVRVLNPASTKP